MSPVAVLLLVAIGVVEASVSAQQLAESVGRPRLESTGVLLSAAGLLVSTAVFLGLGYLAAETARLYAPARSPARSPARYCGVREAHTPSR